VDHFQPQVNSGELQRRDARSSTRGLPCAAGASLFIDDTIEGDAQETLKRPIRLRRD